MTNRTLITATNILTGTQVITDGYLEMEEGTIQNLGTGKPNLTATSYYHFGEDYFIIPGMIDIHVHGADGADFMDGTLDAIETISFALPREGVTSFLATTLTEGKNQLYAALQSVATYCHRIQKERHAAELLGVHLEGPFISAKRKGAQAQEHIMTPSIDTFMRLQEFSENLIKVVTLAPEVVNGIDLVKYLHSKGITVSIGHSDATFEEMDKAIQNGATQATHLFNAMKEMHQREPGVVGSALLNDKLTCEIIVDGIHVHPEMIRLAFKLKGRNRSILVTDAMRAKGLGDGSYNLGKQLVMVKSGRATLADGTLAGSVLTMIQAVKNMISYTNCTLEDIVCMTAVNPAKQLKIFHKKGSLSPGKDADIVVLDRNLNIHMTFCRGQLIYKSK